MTEKSLKLICEELEELRSVQHSDSTLLSHTMMCLDKRLHVVEVLIRALEKYNKLLDKKPEPEMPVCSKCLGVGKTWK